MQGEFNYGNDGCNRFDVHASGNSLLSTSGTPENSEINSEESQPLNVNNSNTRLDRYLFYFSSRL